MITIQGFKNSKNSIFILLDADGINEMIDYLNFIKDTESSMHLIEGNELGSEIEVLSNQGEEMYIIPHLKLINIDNLKP